MTHPKTDLSVIWVSLAKFGEPQKKPSLARRKVFNVEGCRQSGEAGRSLVRRGGCDLLPGGGASLLTKDSHAVGPSPSLGEPRLEVILGN